MATAARLAPHRPEPASATLTEVADLAWPAGEWVEVERVHVDPAGLAPVIALDDYRTASSVTVRDARSRVTLWVVALGVAVLLALTAGGELADADPVAPVAGQTVLAPGETLWDVAVAHRPDGVEVRSYLEAIRELNGFDSAAVPAWTVVLLPQG